LEEILDAKTELKLGKDDIVAAIKLPVPQPTDTFWSHKVTFIHSILHYTLSFPKD